MTFVNDATMTTGTKRTKMCKCGKCDGRGYIQAFAHIDNGRCFWCGGTGMLKAPHEDQIKLAMSNARWHVASAFESFGTRPDWSTGTYAAQCAEQLHKVGTENARVILGEIERGRFYSVYGGRWMQATTAAITAVRAAVISHGRAQLAAA